MPRLMQVMDRLCGSPHLSRAVSVASDRPWSESLLRASLVVHQTHHAQVSAPAASAPGRHGATDSIGSDLLRPIRSRAQERRLRKVRTNCKAPAEQLDCSMPNPLPWARHIAAALINGIGYQVPGHYLFNSSWGSESPCTCQPCPCRVGQVGKPLSLVMFTGCWPACVKHSCEPWLQAPACRMLLPVW